MSATKSERLLNLVILLLVSKNYVTKERIKEVIEPYQTSTADAFEKMFERDKEDLRALGIPLEVGHLDKFFEDESGYRIKRDAFELPKLDLAADEVAVLGLAARVWEHAGLASATSNALLKLRAAGHEVDRDALETLAPRLEASEPAFDTMWEATISRTPVRFEYRRPGDVAPRSRCLEPWGVVTVRGRWYVVGYDRDRQAPRLFRLSRVAGEVVREGKPDSFEVPEGTDVRALTASLVPTPGSASAIVLARSGSAHSLRLVAEVAQPSVSGPDGAQTWDRLTLPMTAPEQLAGDLLALGDAVYVEAPPELRELVIQRLQTVTAGEVRQ